MKSVKHLTIADFIRLSADSNSYTVKNMGQLQCFVGAVKIHICVVSVNV